MRPALSRRRFLGGTSLAGLATVAATAGLARHAQALSFQPMPAHIQAAYDAACSGQADPYHARLASDFVAAEQGRRASAAEIEAQLAAMRCPICGCSLAGALPGPARGGNPG